MSERTSPQECREGVARMEARIAELKKWTRSALIRSERELDPDYDISEASFVGLQADMITSANSMRISYLIGTNG